MKNIGLDVGRSRLKSYTDDKKDSFPSYVGEYRPLRLERTLTFDDMIVHYNDRLYYVGQIAESESRDGAKNFLKSKVNPDTILLGLTAIHRLVKDGESIILTVCHPIDNNIPTEKNNMKSMFEGIHEIEVNNVTKRFKVSHVNVTPECACALFTIKGMTTVSHGIDVGSATTNYCTWIKGAWIDRLSGTLPYGTENIGLSIEKLARKIIFDVSQRIQEFRGNLYLIGGIADKIAPYIRPYLTNNQVIPVEDQLFVNAKSCYEIGEKWYANLQKKR